MNKNIVKSIESAENKHNTLTGVLRAAATKCGRYKKADFVEAAVSKGYHPATAQTCFYYVRNHEIAAAKPHNSPAPKVGNLTDKEVKVLKAIDFSEYGDSIQDPVWTWSVTDNFDGASTSVPGIIASLVSKGLVNTETEGPKDDRCTWMTDAGVQEYFKSVGRENMNKWLDDSDLNK